MNSTGEQDSGSGRWTGQFLDRMRQTADPLADATIAAAFQEHEIDGINSLWHGLLRGNELPPEGLPPRIYAFREQSSRFPAWTNLDLIAQGEQFFFDHGVFCLVSLLCASLPECYVLPNEAEVLGTTRNLEAHAYRRVFETTQLIVSVMRRGGLAKQGSGLQAVQKVRLMHAAIRHLILNTPRLPGSAIPPKSFLEIVQRMAPWDVSKFGCPINQEHMAFTLLTFSHVTLRSLRVMKIDASQEEELAYLHCWNVVGYLMGVHEDLLAHTLEDAELLFGRIKERQFGGSEAGTALANALVRATEQIISHETGGWFTRWSIKKFPPIIMRQLLDRKTVAVLKIKRLTFFEWIVRWVLRALVSILENVYRKIVAVFGNRFGNLIVSALTNIPSDWKQGLFKIPSKITEKPNTQPGHPPRG